jgi:hypothetical protein
MPGVKVTRSNPALRSQIRGSYATGMGRVMAMRPSKTFRSRHTWSGAWPEKYATALRDSHRACDRISDLTIDHFLRRRGLDHYMERSAVWAKMEELGLTEEDEPQPEWLDWKPREQATVLSLFMQGFSFDDINGMLALGRRTVAGCIAFLLRNAKRRKTVLNILRASPNLGSKLTGAARIARRRWPHAEQAALQAFRQDSYHLDVAVGRAVRWLGRTEADVRLQFRRKKDGCERAPAEYRLPIWSPVDDARILLHWHCDAFTSKHLPAMRGRHHADLNEMRARYLLLRRDERRMRMARGCLGHLPVVAWDTSSPEEADRLVNGQSSTSVFRRSTPQRLDQAANLHMRGFDLMACSLATAITPLDVADHLLQRGRSPRIGHGVCRPSQATTQHDVVALRTWILNDPRIPLRLFAEALGLGTDACRKVLGDMGLSESILAEI